MDLFSNYALFVIKTLTVMLVLIVLSAVIISMTLRKRHESGRLKLTNLGERYRTMKHDMQLGRMKPRQQKFWHKAYKKKESLKAKREKKNFKSGMSAPQKPVLYVIDFKGGIEANEVASLREEISAVLAVAAPQDQVLVRLESRGGVVHGYGLAASQLQRLRDREIGLTVVIDKVAASGGYMMACVANHIVAAPFAIIGSIGVVAQIPNFHRLLQRNDIDIELHTAGQYKRTLTLLGENSEEGRQKFRADLNRTHHLFKEFVHQMRPELNIEQVATGEHWYGTEALEKGLIDAINTSDDIIINHIDEYDVIAVHYAHRKKMIERFTQSSGESLERLLLRLWQRMRLPLQ